MIYSPIQLAFVKFLKACIVKNKAYGFCNYTNKQLAEKFEFQKKKYSESRIKTLLFETKEYFHCENKGKARQIFASKQDCITIRTRHNQDCITLATSYKLASDTIKPRQETLEPQGLEDLLLSINLNLKNQNQEKEKNTKKEKSAEPKLAVSPSATLSSKDDVMFEEAYQAHRQGEHTGRSSKALSWKKWQSLKREKALPEREIILKAIKIYREANPDSQYRQGFQVFLNARPWLDVEDLESEDDLRRQVREKFERERAEYFADPEKWHSNHMSWSHAA
jgi:hypothetical protein